MSGDDGSWEGLEEAKFSRKEVEMIWHSHAYRIPYLALCLKCGRLLNDRRPRMMEDPMCLC